MKILAPFIEANTSIRVLDLSQCKIGVSGAQAIAQVLKGNSTLQKLNLYRNVIDVDGARSLKDALAVNKSLEYLDLSHNRLREKGIKAITEGIVTNPASKLSTLAIRYNFINDDGFSYLFEEAVLKKTVLKVIYALCNYMSEPFMHAMSKKLSENGKLIYVDQFEKLQYLDQERNDRTIWISPAIPTWIKSPETLI